MTATEKALREVAGLATCPFCGAPALMEKDDSPNFPYMASCGGNNCGATSCAVVGRTKEEVHERWNTRAGN
jgi:hypothetical protein